MTGARASDSVCPRCGGRIRQGPATIPFTVGESVVVLRGVPAETCRSCHESYMEGRVVDRVTELLHRLAACGAEVSVVTFSEADQAEKPLALAAV